MSRVRLMLSVLLLCASAVAAAPQEDRSTPVTSAVPVEKIRFAGSQSAVQMRIEVRSSAGALIYDSDWKDGNILDWLPQDSSGQSLSLGTYRLVMKTKNLAGQSSEKETSLRVDSGGMTVEDQSSASPKITLTAHNGETGQLITTSGDLSFRFGDFLNRKETEAMRLTAAGDLNVNGLIRAKGIVLPDGTILTTAAAGVVTAGDSGSVMRQRPSKSSTPDRASDVRQRVLLLNPPAVPAPRLTPRPNFAPAFQFVVGDTGVSVGTTNPAYRLDVTGPINTTSQYQINGLRMVAGDSYSTFAGLNAGFSNVGATYNTFVGSYAGYSATGVANDVFGANTGQHVTTGGFNAFFGDSAGGSATTEFYNTLLGAATNITAGLTNSTAIGYRAKTAQSDTVVLGSINGVNSATATASTGIATNTPNQYLGIGGGITVDENNTNNGTVLANSLIAFGTAGSNGLSGEAIASQRTSGGNQYGLDFYTLYTKRMSIANNGNVSIVGNLTKGSGSFKIDHPLDPENKYLYHSFVESPDMMNIYNGNVTLVGRGEAVVQLPDWFEALNQDFRYQLTCLHGFAPVYIDEEIAGNQFKIAGGKPGMKVSWQVTGIRHDPYANAHRIQVEEDKPPAERGTYLHPTEFGH